jgi:Protein of unknown function (DUF1501)
MNFIEQLNYDFLQLQTRRRFLRDCSVGLAGMWLAQSIAPKSAAAIEAVDPANPLAPRQPMLPAKAKRVIYLHMAGGPSQFELFDHKPELAKLDGQNCPDEFLAGKRFAFIRGVPQLLGPTYPLHQSGDAGHWISDRLPHHEKIIDRLCFIHTMQTEQFNHAPAQLMMHTGNQNFGYASLGSWVTYGLGSVNQNMPGFVVLLSGGKFPDAGKSVWGSGFLPGVYQGVQCRSQGEPVLFLSNPEGIDSSLRRQVITAINEVNQQTYAELGDPETVTRIAQYEMAYRMQLAASDALDLKQESRETLEMYGAEPGAESLANNCLLARRLIERDVRFIQLFDWGWDAHGASASEALDSGFKKKCEEADKPITALVTDLVRSGLLDDTLVIWGGEFGRTPMRENRAGVKSKLRGRDHHPYAFTVWLAGAGVKPGFSYGETDAFGYYPVKNAVQTRDLQATLLRLLGLDHQKLTYPYQGLNQKLTGVKPAAVVEDILT